MKPVFKVILMAVAYLVTFILGATSGAIHPVCYAYVGALLPFIFAFIYLYTCTLIRGFAGSVIPSTVTTLYENSFGGIRSLRFRYDDAQWAALG